MRAMLILLMLALAGAAFAQSIGGMSGVGPVVSRSASSGGGGGGAACANQLVLDYSNSCALIGQGWGE